MSTEPYLCWRRSISHEWKGREAYQIPPGPRKVYAHPRSEEVRAGLDGTITCVLQKSDYFCTHSALNLSLYLTILKISLEFCLYTIFLQIFYTFEYFSEYMCWCSVILFGTL